MFERLDIILLVTIFLPAVGALLICLLQNRGRAAARQSALVTTLATLALAAWLIVNYPLGGGSDFAFASLQYSWLGESSPIDIRFSIALDGLSLWLFGLSALLSVTAVLVSWEAIEDRAPAFYALLLMLETGMLGVFSAQDIILFYIFFEFTLIPLFFLIGIWGSEERRYAALKFFLFTLAGSLLTFLSLISIVLWNHSATGDWTFSIPGLAASIAQHPIPAHLQTWMFLGLFAGFAIKVPLFPLHTWLPLAHVQAPTAGSVILAGILLKIGGYGFVRFCFPFLPDATAVAAPWLLWLSVAGIIYGVLVALAQADIKKLIAYSSVSHLGFCMLGIFALNRLGMQGGVLQLINHGLSTGGLFAIVGMLYERYHTRQISDLGGLARRMPLLAFFMLVFTFSSIGLPGLNGFTGEFLVLAGMFQRAWADSPPLLRTQLLAISVLSVFGVVLGAWYMLWLVQRTFFEKLKEPVVHGHGAAHPPTNMQTDAPAHDHGHSHGSGAGHGTDHSHGHGQEAALPDNGIRDMSAREVAALAPLVVFMVWIGLWPGYFLERIAPAVDSLTPPVAQKFDEHYRSFVETAQANVDADSPAPVDN